MGGCACPWRYFLIADLRFTSSVHVSIKEQLSLQFLRDGGLKSLDLKGELELLVSDPSLAQLRLKLKAPSHSADFASDIQFKQHPQVSRFSGDSRVVALRDPKRDFPVGKGLGVVKWKLSSTNEAIVPLASESSGRLPSSISRAT